MNEGSWKEELFETIVVPLSIMLGLLEYFFAFAVELSSDTKPDRELDR